MFVVQKASLKMFWGYSPSSANLVSDWLKAKTALPCMRKKKKKKKKMDDGVDTSLASEGTDQFVDLWEAQPCLRDPE